MERRKVAIKIVLDEEEYRSLEAVARSMGYELPTHLVEAMIRGLIRGQIRPETAPQASGGVDVDQLARRLRRTIEDLLNPYTAKIDEISRKLGQLIEMVEAIAEGQAQPRQREEKEERPSPPRRERQYEEQRAHRRRGAMDRLREDGILVSSEAPWINDPERFFASLERRGAKVFRLGRELVAVHPDFWESFVRVLGETAIRDNEEVESLLETSLGPAAAKLFRMLAREGLVYYDEDEASWKVVA